MLLDESFFEQFIGSSFFKVLSLFSITNVQNYNFVVSGANCFFGDFVFSGSFSLIFFLCASYCRKGSIHIRNYDRFK